MAVNAFVYLLIFCAWYGVSRAFPVPSELVSESSTTVVTPTKSPALIGSQCAASLRPECFCQDTKNRLFVICVGLQLSEMMSMGLSEAGPVVWLRIKNGRLPTLGPRAITTSMVEGVQINSSNISQVHQSAFINALHMRSLALQDNNIHEVPFESFKSLLRLEMISLAGNRIKRIPKNAFTGMPHLYYVSLSQNLIDTIETDCFNEEVRQLAMSSNRLTTLNESVVFLQHLEWLLLTENMLTTLKGQLTHLYSLTHLHVGSNKLTDLSESFNNLRRLKILSLSHNAVSFIGESDFHGLTSLFSLELSFNRISNISSNAFHDLRHLTMLHLSGNRLIDAQHFLEPVSHVLVHLYLNSNLLTRFDVVLPMVRYMDLSDNQLTSVFDSNSVVGGKHYAKLEHLALSNNHLTRLPDKFGHLAPDLVSLHLDGNRLTDLDHPIVGEHGHWVKLMSLNLSSNAIGSVSLRAFHGLAALIELDLSRNQLSRLEPGCFGHMQKLQNLDLSYNRLEYLDLGLLYGLHALQELNLANNLLTDVDQTLFNYLTNLNYLDLSANRIVSLRYFLKPLQQLHTLNISANAITEIDAIDLADLTELRTLIASGNKIATITNTQQLGLPHLSLLKLDNNQLLSVNSLTLWQLPNLHQLDLTNNFLSHLRREFVSFARNGRVHKLHIQGNPWICDNNFISTLLELEAEGVQLDDRNWCINSILPGDGANNI